MPRPRSSFERLLVWLCRWLGNCPGHDSIEPAWHHEYLTSGETRLCLLCRRKQRRQMSYLPISGPGCIDIFWLDDDDEPGVS